MKRVVIVRHAKAVPYGYDDDFSRDLLDPRGPRDAKKVSSKLRNYGVSPDLIMASPAKRALRTAEIFASTFEYPLKNIRIENNLYHGISEHEFANILKNISDEMNVVYVFGHNPTAFYLVKGLVPGFSEDMPTCSSAVINFQTDTWKSAGLGKGTLEFLLSPGMLK
jgi:phosphohistidine phosphatase